jgi:hypothetical protein
MIYKTCNNLDENPELPLEFKNLEEKISQTKVYDFGQIFVNSKEDLGFW